MGSQGSGNGQFVTPRGLGVDKKMGNIYVIDMGNNRIQIFAPNIGINNSNPSSSFATSNISSIDNNQSSNKILVCTLTQYCSNPIEVQPFSLTTKNNNNNSNSTLNNQNLSIITLNQTSTISDNSTIPSNKNTIIQSHAGISDQF